MNMNINVSLSAFKKMLIAFLHRFHVMIFVFVVLGGVIVLILLLNGIVARSGDTSDYVAPNASSAAFDQATTKKIENLKSVDQDGGQSGTPGGRTNPFVE